MKRFEQDQLEEAIEHAGNSGQALYIVGATGRLFDQDPERLVREASMLSGREAEIRRQSTPWQHVVLRDRALDRAIEYTKIVGTTENQPASVHVKIKLKTDEVTILLSSDKTGMMMITSKPLPPLDSGGGDES
jgi:hypothetical protein